MASNIRVPAGHGAAEEASAGPFLHPAGTGAAADRAALGIDLRGLTGTALDRPPAREPSLPEAAARAGHTGGLRSIPAARARLRGAGAPDRASRLRAGHAGSRRVLGLRRRRRGSAGRARRSHRAIRCSESNDGSASGSAIATSCGVTSTQQDGPSPPGTPSPHSSPPDFRPLGRLPRAVRQPAEPHQPCQRGSAPRRATGLLHDGRGTARKAVRLPRGSPTLRCAEIRKG
ncbi:hypothetical protein A4R44_06528 [Amycolatopsis sp. M39]|nr:hypothetical protein A4R44_06528 [Amycolatopsis sp. M39]